jgi:LmbE family N-acetylglucosaminyl deacetylase
MARAARLETTRERWRAAPFRDITDLGEGPILVVAPHPDDETIGCGGLIRQARARGTPVAIDILTDGARSHPNSRAFDASRLAALREAEAIGAAACLGVAPEAVTFWRQPDSALPWRGAAGAALAATMRRRIVETEAAAIFVTWVDDPHCDHEAAFELVVAAAADSPSRPRVHAYPVWSWTIDTPRSVREGAVFRLSIAGDLDAKRHALGRHASQLGLVVPDDPEGFALSASELDLFLRPFETFIAVTA